MDNNEGVKTDLMVYLRERMNQIKEKYVPNGTLNEGELSKCLIPLIREYYLIYWSFPHLSEVYGQVSLYMMGDDHEVNTVR